MTPETCDSSRRFTSLWLELFLHRFFNKNETPAFEQATNSPLHTGGLWALWALLTALQAHREKLLWLEGGSVRWVEGGEGGTMPCWALPCQAIHQSAYTPTYLPTVPHQWAGSVYLSVCKPTNQTTEWGHRRRRRTDWQQVTPVTFIRFYFRFPTFPKMPFVSKQAVWRTTRSLYQNITVLQWSIINY